MRETDNNLIYTSQRRRIIEDRKLQKNEDRYRLALVAILKSLYSSPNFMQEIEEIALAALEE